MKMMMVDEVKLFVPFPDCSCKVVDLKNGLFLVKTCVAYTVADLGGVLWVLQHPQLSPW